MTLALTLSFAAQAQSWPALTPTATTDGRLDAAVIVAIGDYSYVEDVPGAVDTAKDWYNWFRIGRGIPASRVITLYDADASVLRIEEVATEGVGRVQAGGTLWFVFIGHGAPNPSRDDGLLVSVDARDDPKQLVAASVTRSALIARLMTGKQSNTVLMLDACFSGQTPDGRTIVKGSLQTLLPVSEDPPAAAGLRVLTAASSGEFTGGLPGANRPAFSYFALGGLMGWADVAGGNADGRVTLSEVRDYVQGAIRDTGQRQNVRLLEAGGDLVVGKTVAKTPPDVLALLATDGVSGGGGTGPDFIFDVPGLSPKLCEDAARTKGSLATIHPRPRTFAVPRREGRRSPPSQPGAVGREESACVQRLARTHLVERPLDRGV